MGRRQKSPSCRARKGKSAIRRAERWRLAEAQNWRCAHCGCALDMETATTDHVTPVSRGGSNAADNKVASCRPCNEARGKADQQAQLQERRLKFLQMA